MIARFFCSAIAARNNYVMEKKLYVSTACLALGVAGGLCAQTPGEWKYTISTDLRTIPQDMRVNFPTVSFSACRSADDFVSGRAFALQTLASSETRCVSKNFKRASTTSGKSGLEQASFEYACDEGKTLRGNASGRVAGKRFEFEMSTEFPTPVSGVSQLKQAMRASYVGACKVKPDIDEVKLP
jgi:hypothetical protein